MVRLISLSSVALSFAVVASLAGCGTSHSPARQVQSSNPSVTYTYRGDQELVDANQKAVLYCSQYQSVPRTQTITTASNGAKTVVFDCVARPASTTTTTTTIVQPPLNTGYTYRTDQELLDASGSAANYCYSQGSQRAVSTILNNPDGTRTITFRCVP